MKTLFTILALMNTNGYTLDAEQTKCLATAVWSEARGETEMGQATVAHVILNRVKSKRHPNTICEVVYQPWQFSYIEKARPDYNSKAWEVAVEVAAYTQAGLVDDWSKGSTLYYSHVVMDKPKSWDFTKLELQGSYGGHTFYTETQG